MSWLAELSPILDNLLRLHQALYTLAIEKRKVLLKNDIDTLNAITLQEQKLIKAIEAAEASRIERVEQLFKERNLPLSQRTLTDLIKSSTNNEEKTKLAAYREEMLRLIDDLRKENELNQQLLQQSLAFVNMSLDFFTDDPVEDFIYKKPVQSATNSTSNRSFINRKV
ncbi:flagellar protein FlgN [Brevibacillus fulvus]|uniref:Flagellar biosynthesis/type III secretory pathway chaperone n=1 Tax=Brevibacillus fulvus TaxID=1125967 RepID=A0A938Y1L4_9BACL|nr:flagellar protein FlgN [Brevibacillus fulvus]MBM7591508.1 flagellar biosynthesis/type III secretory pathway chaperone [Brevibacillus fulvus]